MLMGMRGDAHETPSILRSSDFGAFEPELKRAFRSAFHFDWDITEDSPDEHQRRKAFARFIHAARVTPDVEPTRGLELLRKCYALQLEILRYLGPDEVLRDEFAGIGADISNVGEQIAKLPRTGWTVNIAEGATPSCGSMEELSHAWRALEDGTLGRLYATQLTAPSDEISRLSILAAETRIDVDAVRLALSRMTLRGKNTVTSSERGGAVIALASLLEELSRKLAAFSQKCVAPPDNETTFHDYLERVAEALPVQTTYGMVPRDVAHWTEVPDSALIMPRKFADRRAAILQWLCTSDPDFFPLLPSKARRDHRAPATKGGAQNPNWVLPGLAAALVLLELVDREPDARQLEGKDLFELIVKQVDAWIRKQAATGFFFVDADASEPTVPGRRPHSAKNLPLVPRYPTRAAEDRK